MSNFSTYLPKKGLKLECPACNGKKCFRQYYSTDTDAPIHYSVGICDHANSCGYHYPPKQFFIDNPDKKQNWTKWTASQHAKPRPAEPPRPMGLIPAEYVTKSESIENHLIEYLFSVFGKNNQNVMDVCRLYRIGSTRQREAIFWQIDVSGNVRTGKIMQYNPTTGKRIKKEPDLPDWVHSKMKYRKQLPEDYNLQQCYFGTHLLKQFQDKQIRLVEGEKTAIICTILQPDYLWLASGGLQQINTEKSKIFAGRDVVLFPDLGMKDSRVFPFANWTAKANEISKAVQCKISVSDFLERIATTDDRSNGLDIADFYLRAIAGVATAPTQPPPPESPKAPAQPPPPPKAPTVKLADVAMQVIGLENNIPKDKLIMLLSAFMSLPENQATDIFAEMISRKIIENVIDDRYYLNVKNNTPF